MNNHKSPPLIMESSELESLPGSLWGNLSDTLVVA